MAQHPGGGGVQPVLLVGRAAELPGIRHGGGLVVQARQQREEAFTFVGVGVEEPLGGGYARCLDHVLRRLLREQVLTRPVDEVQLGGDQFTLQGPVDVAHDLEERRITDGVPHLAARTADRRVPAHLAPAAPVVRRRVRPHPRVTVTARLAYELRQGTGTGRSGPVVGRPHIPRDLGESFGRAPPGGEGERPAVIGQDEGALPVGENGQEVEYGVFGAEYNNDVDHRIGPLYETDGPQGAHARSRPLRGARDGTPERHVSAARRGNVYGGRAM